MTVPHWLFMKLSRPARTTHTPRETSAHGIDVKSNPRTSAVLPAKTPHGPTPMGDRESGISSKN